MEKEKLLSLLKFKTQYNKTYFIVNRDVFIKEQDINIYKGAIMVNTGLFDDISETSLSIIYYTKPSSTVKTRNIKEGIIVLPFEHLLALLLAKKITPFLVDDNCVDEEIMKKLK